MKFEINWTAFQWFLFIVQFAAIGAQVATVQTSRKIRKILEKRSAELDAGFQSLRDAQPEAIAAALQAEILLRMTHGVELFERVQNDVIYLHDALYRVTAHPPDCAICRATGEELEVFIKAMRGAKVDIMPPPQQ